MVSNCPRCQIVLGVKLSSLHGRCQIVLGVKLSSVSNCPITIRITPNTFCKIAALIFFLVAFRCKTPFCSCSAWRPCLTRRGHRRHHSFCSSLKAKSEHCSQTYGRRKRNLFPVHFVTPEYVMLDMRIRLYPRFFMQKSKPEHKQRVPQCKKFTLHSAQWVWKICVSKKMSDTECHAAQSGQKCALCKKCNHSKPSFAPLDLCAFKGHQC